MICQTCKLTLVLEIHHCKIPFENGLKMLHVFQGFGLQMETILS